MVKHDVVKEVARRTGITQADAELAVNTIREIIVQQVRKEGRFRFNGLGVFTNVRRGACTRAGFGRRVDVPAHNIVKFKASPVFKAAVNP